MSIPSEVEPFELAVVARGVARMSVAELAAMRKQPPACFSVKLNPLFLKHSDEQTLAALAALYRARAEFGMEDEDFGPWAVVSISRFLGRAAFGVMLDKFVAEGAWGVSVQVIPHRTAHSVSGTISLGLGMHGPAIGANGGHESENTGLLALAGIMRQAAWRGVWLVSSKWLPEAGFDRKGQAGPDSVCVASALALVHAGHPRPWGYLRFEPAERFDANSNNRVEADRDAGLLEYIFEEERREPPHRVWRRSLANGLRIELGLSACERTRTGSVAGRKSPEKDGFREVPVPILSHPPTDAAGVSS